MSETETVYKEITPRAPLAYTRSELSGAMMKPQQAFSSERRLIVRLKLNTHHSEIRDALKAFRKNAWHGGETLRPTFVVASGKGGSNVTEVAVEHADEIAFCADDAERLLLETDYFHSISPGVYEHKNPAKVAAKAARVTKSKKSTEPEPERHETAPEGLREVLTPDGKIQAADFYAAIRLYSESRKSLPKRWLSRYVIDAIQVRWPAIKAVDDAIGGGITLTLRQIENWPNGVDLPGWWKNFAVAMANGHPSRTRAAARMTFRAACLAQRGEDPLLALREARKK